MKLWSTEIRAVVDEEIRVFCGPNIKAPSRNLAYQYCQMNGLGYCVVGDEVISEIPARDDLSADWDKRVDYDEQLN